MDVILSVGIKAQQIVPAGMFRPALVSNLKSALTFPGLEKCF